MGGLAQGLGKGPLGGGGATGESLHCALLLDYVPPEDPQANPLETPLELGNPNCPSSRKLQTTFPHITHIMHIWKSHEQRIGCLNTL